MITRPSFEAASQDTVVVIHGQGDGAHVAIVTTTLDLGDGPGVAESVDRIVVVQGEDGNYRLDLTVPEDEVIKGGRWTVTVLLAPGTGLVDGGPIEESDDTRGFQQFDPPGDRRPIAVWWGEADPPLQILWTLLR